MQCNTLLFNEHATKWQRIYHSHQNQLCIIINILLDFKLKWVINTQYLISSFLFYLFIYCFVFKDVNATVLSSWWHLLYCERLATRWRKKQPYSYWRFSNEICIDFFFFLFLHAAFRGQFLHFMQYLIMYYILN